MNELQRLPAAGKAAGAPLPANTPDPDLAQRVADLVYAMFVRDLQLDRERRGDYGAAGAGLGQGGRRGG